MQPLDPNAVPTLVERQQYLHRLRALKMARSAHAYVRGSTEQFYDWVTSPDGTRLPQGPAVWICGDCHVGNLGPVGQIAGAAVIEIRDLDQTVIGNPAYDLVRLGLSLAMASRGSSLPGVTTARMTEHLVAGYEAAFEGEVPSEKVDQLPAPIGFVMKRAIRRTQEMLLGERVGRDQVRFKIGKRFWQLTAEEREAVAQLVQSEAIRDLVTGLAERDDQSQVRFLDAAYWVKGCSSLGLWRGAILTEIFSPGGRKKARRGTVCLLDFKEAVDPATPALRANGLASDPASRVVMGAGKIAPALGRRMLAAPLLGRSIFVRELMPQDLKVELDELSVADGKEVAHYLGMVVGRAHSRQMDEGQRRSWLSEMHERRTKNIDAPSWLWAAVVELVGLHERAYLEHCRRYAMEQDALPAT
ncbi:MAG: DUF2252 family protein [Kofleriaceae bacterium]